MQRYKEFEKGLGLLKGISNILDDNFNTNESLGCKYPMSNGVHPTNIIYLSVQMFLLCKWESGLLQRTLRKDAFIGLLTLVEQVVMTANFRKGSDCGADVTSAKLNFSLKP